MTAAPKMAQTMLTAMLLMSLAAWAYTIAVALHRVRSIIIEREAHADWIAAWLENTPRGAPDTARHSIAGTAGRDRP